jgi:hypothetical protein
LFYKPDIRHGLRFIVTDRDSRYYEETLRLLNEILAALKENNRMLREHNSVVSSIDERVRRIGVNTSNLR